MWKPKKKLTDFGIVAVVTNNQGYFHSLRAFAHVDLIAWVPPFDWAPR